MFLGVICMESKKMAIFKDLRLGSCLAAAYFMAINRRLKLNNSVAYKKVCTLTDISVFPQDV